MASPSRLPPLRRLLKRQLTALLTTLSLLIALRLPPTLQLQLSNPSQIA